MDSSTFQREMAVWLVTQGAVILASVFGIVMGLLRREEDRIVSRTISASKKLMEDHDESVNSHGPLIKRWEKERDEKLDRLIMVTADAITLRVRDAFQSMISSHNSDPFAHGPASDHNHAPLMNAMDKIGVMVAKLSEKIDTVDASVRGLVLEHNVIIRGNGKHPCSECNEPIKIA